jgi:ATP-dependent helicase HrpB
VALLAWRIVGNRGLMAQLGAGLAGIGIYAFPTVFWIGNYVGAWPYVAAICMTGIVIALFMSVPTNPERALAAGPAAFADARALRLLQARIATVRNAGLEAGLPALDDGVVREALAAMCEGRRSFAELREASLLDLLRSRLGASARRLDELAPPEFALPGGRRLRIQYELDKPPWAESWLQDFFGMRRGPNVAGGRVPLTLHLLAPNRRAVQVTTDLAGFWEKHYPALRRSLSRRYPRHAWPEDPLAAVAERRPRRASRKK